MDLTKQTFGILSNFSSINNAIHVKEKQCLTTINEAASIIGVYDTEETFENEFALYDLQEFLGVLSMFGNTPQLEFDKDFIRIKNDKQKVKYVVQDSELIPQKCELGEDYKSLDSWKANFELTKEQLTNILKASRIMNLDALKITMKKGKGKLTLFDTEKTTANDFEVRITGSGDAEAVIETKNLLIVNDDYVVYVDPEQICKFKNKNLPLFYIIALHCNDDE